MFSDEIVLSSKNLSKYYEIYEKPGDMLKQFIFPKIARLFGRKPKKYFREFAALNAISFSIKRGETVGIIGRNGSGKSTLLQIICGTLASTAGQIASKGRIAALLELGSGFNLDFTGRENVRLNALIMGLSSQQVDEKMTQILEFADIGSFIDQPVRTYSSGMFMRLAFAVQANIDPDILIIDEALAVGDIFFIHKCMSRIRNLKEAGTTILIVSHDSTAIKTLCDRALWIDGGSLMADGDASKVVDLYLNNQSSINIVHPTDSMPNKLESGSKLFSDPSPSMRGGDQSLKIMGVLFQSDGISREIVEPYESIEILLKIKNISLNPGVSLVIGYVLKNIRGIDISSSNNNMEDCPLYAPNCGVEFLAKIKFNLPNLHPGQYSFTVSIASQNDQGELVALDHCENLINFEFSAKKLCHVLMTFETRYFFVDI